MNTENHSIKDHWDKIYSNSEITKLGWHEDIPQPSIDLVKECRFNKDAAILDVGSGTTNLLSYLIKNDFKNVTALDISEEAIKKSKQRLKDDQQKLINWVVDDITNPKNLNLSDEVDLWHDRTVLHFLTAEKQQNGYLSTLRKIVKPAGCVIIAVFSLEGAKKCSGLDVKNYDEKMLIEFLGDEFNLIKHFNYLYIQPTGGERPYVYTLFKRMN